MFSARERVEVDGLFNPPACCEAPACLHAQWGRVDLDPAAGDRGRLAALQIGVTFPTPTGPPPPLDAIVVLDVSASLRRDDTMEAIRLGLRSFVEQLRPQDRVGLITFRGNIEVPIPLSPIQEIRSDFIHEVETTPFGGGTDLSSGLSMGYTIAARERDLSRQSRIIVLTDGVPTWGVAQPEQLVAIVSDGIAGGTLLSGYVIGDESSDDFFEELIEDAAGRLTVLPDPRELEAALMAEAARDTRTLFAEFRLGVRFESDVGHLLWSGSNAVRDIAGAQVLSIPQIIFEPDRGTVAPGFGAVGGDALVWALPTPPSGAPGNVGLELEYRVAGGDRYEDALQLEIPVDLWAADQPSFFDPPEMAQNVLRMVTSQSVESALIAADEGSDPGVILSDAAARVDDFVAPRGEAVAPLATDERALVDAVEAALGVDEGVASDAEWPGL